MIEILLAEEVHHITTTELYFFHLSSQILWCAISYFSICYDTSQRERGQCNDLFHHLKQEAPGLVRGESESL